MIQGVDMLIKVNTDGTVEAVYSDMLRKLNLGPMNITRASNVEFNITSQQWEARTPTGELIAAGPERAKVIEQEVKVLEERLAAA